MPPPWDQGNIINNCLEGDSCRLMIEGGVGLELRCKLLEELEHAQAVLVRPDRVPLPHTMIAWDSSHYLTTLNSIEVAWPMVADSPSFAAG